MKHPHSTPHNPADREFSDREFADRMRKLLPDAPPHPMFTRMVMNRLPRRSVRILAVIEYTLYIIGVATTGVIATKMAVKMSSASEIPIATTLTMLTLIALFFSLIYALILPFTTRR